MKRLRNKIAFIVIGYYLGKTIKKFVSRVEYDDVRELVGEVYAG